MDLTEAEGIMKRWQEYSELYRRDLNDLDNHNDHSPRARHILQYRVKWALGSITMNKASGGNGISVELFHVLKYNVAKVTQYASKFGKLSNGHRNGKGQFSFQS